MAIDDYTDLFTKYGAQYGVDPLLLKAIATQESGGDPAAVGPDTKYGNAEGLMQIIPDTAKRLGVDPAKPEAAVEGAAKLLSENLKRYGSVDKAILAYHGGTDEANWGPKTQDYHQKVSSIYNNLKGPSDAVGSDAQDTLAKVENNTPFGRLMNKTQANTPDAALTQNNTPFLRLMKKANTVPATEAAPNVAQNAPAAPDELAVSKTGELPVFAGMSPQQAAELQKEREVGSNIASGVGRGLHDVANTAANATMWGANKLGIMDPGDMRMVKGMESTERNQWENANKDAKGSDIGRFIGQTAATLPIASIGGKILSGAGNALADTAPAVGKAVDFLSGTSEGNKLVQAASRGTAGVLQGARAAAITSGASDVPFWEQLKEGGKIGGVLNTVIPGADMAIKSANKFMTGGGASSEVANLAKLAEEKYGIPISGAQVSNSPFIHYLDSMTGKVPFSGAPERAEEAAQAFTKAVSGTFGESAEALTTKVMSGARSRIGNMFNEVAKNTSINADDVLVGSLARIESEASQTLSEGEVKPIHNQINNILSKIGDGDVMPGKEYQMLTRKGAPLDVAGRSSNPNIREYANQIRNTLDDALERSAAPEDLNLLKTARLQWKNMKTVEALASKANIEGEITPPALINAVRKSYRDMAYTGAGDIGELAQIGNRFLKEAPSSGTAERLTAMRLLGVGGGLEGLAAYSGHPLAGPLVAGGIIGSSKLANSALNSQIYKNMLLRSALSSGADTTIPSAVGKFISSNYIPAAVIARNRLAASAQPQ